MTTGIGKGVGLPWQASIKGSNPVGSSDRTKYATDSAPAPGPNPPGPAGPGGRGRGKSTSIFPLNMVQQGIGATTGDIDIVIKGFKTPVAAIFSLGEGRVVGTVENDSHMSLGATDGTNHWYVSSVGKHAEATSQNRRLGNTDAVIALISNTDANIFFSVTFVRWIKDGVRLNVGATDGNERQLIVTLIGGSGVAAAVGSGALANTSATVTFTPGFEADVLMIVQPGQGIDGVAGLNNVYSVGFGTWDGATVLQTSYFYTSIHAASFADCRSRLKNDTIITFNDTRTVTLGNITLTQFDLTSSADDLTSKDIGFVAINLGDSGKSWTGILTTPTSTGENSLTGVGFKPTGGLMVPTMLPTEDTESLTGDAGAAAFSAFNETNQFCNSYADEDGQTVMDIQGKAVEKIVDLDADDGTDGLEVSFSSFDTDGMTLDFTIVDGTARLWPTLLLKI